MACIRCGARLPARSNICIYCKTINDHLLGGGLRSATSDEDPTRNCPRCDVKLSKIDLENHLKIDLCAGCGGTFLDLGELERLAGLYHRIAETGEKPEYLHFVTQDNSDPINWPVSYLQCPVCNEHMSRTTLDGDKHIIVNSCTAHGLWVDYGVLKQALENARSNRAKSNGQTCIVHEKTIIKQIGPDGTVRETTTEKKSGGGDTAAADLAFEAIDLFFSLLD